MSRFSIRDRISRHIISGGNIDDKRNAKMVSRFDTKSQHVNYKHMQPILFTDIEFLPYNMSKSINNTYFVMAKFLYINR